MGEDLKTRLANAAFKLELLTYSNLSIEDSYAKFCAELAGKKIIDSRNQVVHIYERNFPKLLGMKRADPATGQVLIDQHGQPLKAKASVVLASLKSGTFDPRHYFIEYGRLRTMFWIPDVIKTPDSIRPNAHDKIEGDRVYVKKYQKKGSDTKLVFTNFEKGERIVITSFLVKESQLDNYVTSVCIWPENTKATFAGGLHKPISPGPGACPEFTGQQTRSRVWQGPKFLSSEHKANTVKIPKS